MPVDRYDFGGVMFSFFYEYDRLLRSLSADSGLYSGQPRVLTIINNNPGCTLSELSELIGVGMPSLSVSVRNMRRSGLIQDEEGRAKGRRLYLTGEGQAKAMAFHRLFDAFLVDFLDSMGPDHAEVIDAELGRMLAFFRRYREAKYREE